MPRKKTGFIQTIKTRCRNIRFAVRGMLHRGSDVIHNIAEFLMVISGIAALTCIVCLVIHVGYEHSPQGFETISRILRAMQWIFGANVIFGLTFNLAETLKKNRWLKWTVDIALLVSLLPVIYPRPIHPWIPWLRG